MGTTRDDGSQQSMWVSAADLPRGGGHPFYERLNRILEAAGFDAFVEGLCAQFYAAKTGRPSLAPGRYFRLLLIGYFEGLDSERAIAWRAADSLSVRTFLRLASPASPPDHSTISRTRRLLSVEAHQAVFGWVLERLAEAKLVSGKTSGIDATTLEANAAMRSIVRRDTGDDYTAFLTRLAQASGIETPTAEDLAALGVRSHIAEPDRIRRNWKDRVKRTGLMLKDAWKRFDASFKPAAPMSSPRSPALKRTGLKEAWKQANVDFHRSLSNAIGCLFLIVFSRRISHRISHRCFTEFTGLLARADGRLFRLFEKNLPRFVEGGGTFASDRFGGTRLAS